MNTTKIEYEEAKIRAINTWLSFELNDRKHFKCPYCLDTTIMYRDGFGGFIDCKECVRKLINTKRNI